jgi:hypothetical protein
LYRYEIEDSRPALRDLRDGTLLAFVQGTDPEELLLLEAVVIDKRPRWQYAFSRSTSGRLEARLVFPLPELPMRVPYSLLYIHRLIVVRVSLPALASNSRWSTTREGVAF